MSTRVRVLPTLEVLAAQAAVFIAETIRETCARNGSCSVALAGGSTPAPIYRLLAEERIAWGQVRLFLGDERCVPSNDAQSNAHMLRKTLVDAFADSPAGERPTFHPMEGAAEDPETAAAAYAAQLPESFDLMLLGVGQDGHTASLFPGSPALESDAGAVVTSGPKPPNPRITVTPNVVRAAREVVVVAAGADKAQAIARALAPHCDPHDAPAALARHGIWFLDRAAAEALESEQQ